MGMTPEEMEALFRRHREAKGAADFDAILDTSRTATWRPSAARDPSEGRARAARAAYVAYFTAFPDRSAPEDDGFAYGDDVLVIWGHLRGTSGGEWLGVPPSGGSFAVPFTNVTTFADGRMAGETISFDLATLCEQAGLPLDTIRAAAAARRGAWLVAVTPTPTAVDFHFDVMCPWAYQASLWIREVREHAGIDIRWRFFSLEEINRVEGKKHPWERPWSYGWSMMRIGALLRRTDMDLLDRWYDAAGTALHVDGRKPHRPRGGRGAARRARPRPRRWCRRRSTIRPRATRCTPSTGWSSTSGSSVSRRCDSTTARRCSAPSCSIRPPAPTRSGSGSTSCGWLEHPNVYEIKRPKRADDLRRIAEAFRPYLEARDWVTIQKEAP